MPRARASAVLGSILALTLLVSCETILGGPDVRVTPSSLDLGAGATGDVLADTIAVENVGSAAATVDVSDDSTWLTVSPSSLVLDAGETETVTVTGTCAAGMEGTTEQGTVTVAYGDTTRTVDVEIACFAASDLLVSPAQAFLSGEEGDTPALTASLVNTTGAPIDFTVANAPSWLDVDPTFGTVPANGSVDLTLALVAACPVARSVQGGAFDVVTSEGTLTVDAFQVCAEAPENAYNVDIRFFGDGFDVPTIEDFLDAAATWESVITDDLESYTIAAKAAGACSGPGFPTEPALDGETVDDLFIHAGVADIDGEFGIVGSAGPCIVRPGGSADPLLPAYGTAFFDVDDVQRLQDEDRFGAVVLHEMGHAIGIGTLWDLSEFDLIDYAPTDDDCRVTSSFDSGPSYTGSEGVAAYASLAGGSPGAVPLEDEGGAGTRCGHWDEDVFDDELMTGFLDATSDPLSELTGDSLRDLGYATNEAAYDPYAIPGCSPACGDRIEPQELHLEEVLLFPRYVVRPDGALEPIGPTLD